MKFAKLIPALIMDALAIILVVLGVKNTNMANELSSTITSGKFAEGQLRLQENYEFYALLEFIGAGLAFFVGAFFILKAIKSSKEEKAQSDDWQDIA